MAINILPTDDWLRVSRIFVQSDYADPVFIPGSSGTIYEFPSSYRVKAEETVKVNIGGIHTPWLHTDLAIDTPILPSYITFRNSLQEAGNRMRLNIPNPKMFQYRLNDDGMAAVRPNIVNAEDALVPAIKIGTPIPNSTAFPTHGQNIGDDIVDITPDHLFKYTIHVKESPAEDTYFQFPVSTPELEQGTILGKTGRDSTLAPGMVAGLVGLCTEVKLSSALGDWYGNATAIAALKNETQTLQTQTQQKVGDDTPPSWYTSAVGGAWLQNSALYKQLQPVIGEPYYACGAESFISTFGTGVFCFDENMVGTLTKVNALVGVNDRKIIRNSGPDSVRESIPIGELADSTAWQNKIVRIMQGDLLPVHESVWLPCCGTSIQAATVPATPAPTGVRFGQMNNQNYAVGYPTKEDSVFALPLFESDATNSMHYQPFGAYNRGRRINVATFSNYGETISTLLAVPDTILDGATNAAPAAKIAPYPGIIYGSAAAPLADYQINQRGFRLNHSMSSFSGTYTWTATLQWYNDGPMPTVGQESTSVLNTCIPVISTSTVALIGVIPAGTPVGDYTFQPFNDYMSVKPPIDYTSIDHTNIGLIGSPDSPSTQFPNIGPNYVTTETQKLDWAYRTWTDIGTSYTVAAPLVSVRPSVTSGAVTSNTEYIRIVLQDLPDVPLIGYPLTTRPMVVDIMEDGQELCGLDDLMQTAPFKWLWYKEQLEQGHDDVPESWYTVVAIISANFEKIYIVQVELDENMAITKYVRLVHTRDFRDMQWGDVRRVMGICHTRDIEYFTGKETDVLALYVLATFDAATDPNTSRAVVLLRNDFTYDMDHDLVSRIMTIGPTGQPYQPTIDEQWPCGIAVIYPYVYTLGYVYTRPSAYVYRYGTPSGVQPLDPAVHGWQMCLTRTDILSGVSHNKAIVCGSKYFRFLHGLPADQEEYMRLVQLDSTLIDGYARYEWPADASGEAWDIPHSDSIPKWNSRKYPTLAGLTGISAQLLAVHNGESQPVLINPVSCLVEAYGESIYPYQLPFNSNIASSYELLYAMYKFQGRTMSAIHPFVHLCIGDGLGPTPFASGIDVQDASFGTTVIRRVMLRNNLLRDVMEDIHVTVPEPAELPDSEMLWVGPTNQGPWEKEITFADLELAPNETYDFFIKVEPLEEKLEPITLYLNAEFKRRTALFGFREEKTTYVAP